MVDHIIAGLSLIFRVYLAEKYGAGRCGPRLHAVEREKRLVLIPGEYPLADKSEVEIRADSARDADKRKRNDEFPVSESAQVDRRDGSYDHYVEHETRYAVLHEIVGIIAFYHAFFHQGIQDRLYEYRADRAEKELEAPDHALQRPRDAGSSLSRRVEQFIESYHNGIGQSVGYEDKRDLDRELVHRLRDRDLIFPRKGVYSIFLNCVLPYLAFENTFFSHDIQADDAADAGRYESHCRDCKAERGTVFKSVLHFVGVSPAVSLSRALPVAHREYDPGSKEAAYDLVQNNCNKKSEYSLQKIPVYHRNARIESACFGNPVRFLRSVSERESRKAEPEAVISQYLKCRCFIYFDSESRFEKPVDKQKQKASKNRARDHKLSDESDIVSQDLGNDHGYQKLRQREQKSPDIEIP